MCATCCLESVPSVGELAPYVFCTEWIGLRPNRLPLSKACHVYEDGMILYGDCLSGEDERLAPFFPNKDEGWLDTSRSFFPVNLAGFWTIQVRLWRKER